MFSCAVLRRFATAVTAYDILMSQFSGLKSSISTHDASHRYLRIQQASGTTGIAAALSIEYDRLLRQLSTSDTPWATDASSIVVNVSI